MKELIRRTLRETVFGMEDGMISTLGAMTGVAAGTKSGPVVALAGLVIVAVESISMAAGSYLSSKSQRQYLESLIKEEKDQIERDPEGERREIHKMYSERGYTPDEIAIIEKRLMSDKHLLLEDMAHKELGVIPDRLEHPAGNALSMGLSYILGGSIPLLPYLLLSFDTAFPTSIFLTGAALFALGAAKGKVVKLSWWFSGLEMLGVGAAACGLGYLVGRFGSRFLS
jgi:predicted membrane protein (TIGR00267 family)